MENFDRNAQKFKNKFLAQLKCDAFQHVFGVENPDLYAQKNPWFFWHKQNEVLLCTGTRFQ